MINFFSFFAFTLVAFSSPVLADRDPKCEFIVTFYNLDKRVNKPALEQISEYINNNDNLIIESEIGTKSFYNFCLGVSNNNIEAELDLLKDAIFKPTKTGLISVDSINGAKIMRGQ